MLKILFLISFVFLISNTADAGKLCLKVVDGEAVYTNLCDVRFEKKSKKTAYKPIHFSTASETKYSREELERIVEEKSKKYGLDVKLIKEMIREESGWNVNAVSPKGAMGIMQLMPSTALLMGVKNPFDPNENIDAGIRYMKYLLEKFNGNIALALAAYNAGPNLVERLGRVPNIPETQGYVHRISLRYSGSLPQNLGYSHGKRVFRPIKAVVLEDGSVLYTNVDTLWIRR